MGMRYLMVKFYSFYSLEICSRYICFLGQTFLSDPWSYTWTAECVIEFRTPYLRIEFTMNFNVFLPLASL